MCGIVGFINKEYNLNSNKKNITNMTKKLSHRGPDYYNTWNDDKKNIYLGHTRLSILDLSSNGHQPMYSHNKKFIIVYNGEIYNHLEIREKIKKFMPENFNWKSNSDTETLINAIASIGMQKTLNLVNGMFAFACFDIEKKILFISRDRSGEKPIYYGFCNNTFIFGSELKAIKINTNFNNNINKNSLSDYLQYSYIPSPLSIYENINKLRPGHLIEINVDKINCSSSHSNILITKWVDDKRYFLNQYENKSSNILINELHGILKNSIKNQMITDVPIGAFLSGGIDSSLVVSIMQELSTTPIDTFTIGFENKNFDESIYASKIKDILKTNHNELFVSHKDLLNEIPNMHKIYDEPFADSSQIPTYLLSKFARTKVKVSLSGDGGDELFGGYNRYLWGEKVWLWIKYVPIPMRIVISKFLLLFSENFLNKLEKPINKFLLGNLSISNMSEKVKKLHSKINASRNFNEFYLNIISEWSNLNEILIEKNAMSEFDFFNVNSNNSYNNTQKMMFWDYNSYLPDDILCKLDRAAMSNSLETRVPFLDKHIIEFAFNLPLKYKIRNKKSKWILREILKKYLPNELIDRPKMGFSIPLASWLRGPLKKWAETIIFEGTLNNNEYFIHDNIKSLWKKHINYQEDNHNKIWQLLIFSSWNENNKDL